MIVLQPHWACPVLSPQHPPQALCPEAQPILQARRWSGCVLTAPSLWCPASRWLVAFSPGNLSTSSSASLPWAAREQEYILSFETIDKMRRVSSTPPSTPSSLSPASPSPLVPWAPTGSAWVGSAETCSVGGGNEDRLAVTAGTSPLDAGLTQAVRGASLVLGQATGLPRLQSWLVLPSGDFWGVVAW